MYPHEFEILYRWYCCIPILSLASIALIRLCVLGAAWLKSQNPSYDDSDSDHGCGCGCICVIAVIVQFCFGLEMLLEMGDLSESQKIMRFYLVYSPIVLVFLFSLINLAASSFHVAALARFLHHRLPSALFNNMFRRVRAWCLIWKYWWSEKKKEQYAEYILSDLLRLEDYAGSKYVFRVASSRYDLATMHFTVFFDLKVRAAANLVRWADKRAIAFLFDQETREHVTSHCESYWIDGMTQLANRGNRMATHFLVERFKERLYIHDHLYDLLVDSPGSFKTADLVYLSKVEDWRYQIHGTRDEDQERGIRGEYYTKTEVVSFKELRDQAKLELLKRKA